MMFIELFAPEGAFTGDQRREIGERFITEVMGEDMGPKSLIDGARSVCHALVHETSTLVAGDGDPAARYLVRVSVPLAWRAVMSDMLIERVTAVLADYVDDARRLYEHPHAWVQVHGVPDKSYGAYGKPLTSTDTTRLMTERFRGSADLVRAEAALAPGMGIDPVCGMSEPLEGAKLTLDHDGSRYAFCSPQCRVVFAEDKGIELTGRGAR